jgi:hypothetical protein
MAKAGKELLKRLTAPEIREIVREEISAAVRPLEIKIEEMDKRLTGEIKELDKRLTGEIKEMDRRITGEIASLRHELQYAPKVAVLEAKVIELEKKMTAR